MPAILFRTQCVIESSSKRFNYEDLSVNAQLYTLFHTVTMTTYKKQLMWLQRNINDLSITEYIPWIMRIIMLRFVSLQSYHQRLMMFVNISPISFRVNSLAQGQLARGQSYDCSRASEITLKAMAKFDQGPVSI